MSHIKIEGQSQGKSANRVFGGNLYNNSHIRKICKI